MNDVANILRPSFGGLCTVRAVVLPKSSLPCPLIDFTATEKLESMPDFATALAVYAPFWPSK